MSLLIEALRQAEARKKPAPADDTGAAAAAASTPASTPTSELEPRSAPPLSLEPIEPPATTQDHAPADRATAATGDARRPASNPPPRMSAAAGPRQQAQTVLSASIGAGRPRRGPGLLLAGLAALIAVSLGGAWWLLESQGRGSLQAALPPPQDTAASAAPDTDSDGTPAAVLTAAATDIDAMPTAMAPTPAIAAGTPMDVPAEPSRPAAVATAEPRPAEPPSSSSPLAPTAGDAVALRRHQAPVVTRGVSRASALAQGYQALQADRLDEAEVHYAQALRQSPRHPDALLGLGAIAERRGDIAAAVAHYRQVLQVEPEHPVALAALAEHVGGADPLATESRLRGALAAQPQAAPLHFALGNRLAEEGRWSEAQQAYFQAHALTPDNADYAFNLAVALDRLRKPALAAEHYRRALALAAGGAPHAFDPAAAQRRLRTLEAATVTEAPAR